MSETKPQKRTLRINPLASLRRFYDWVLGWADHPQGEIALYFTSAIESIFFPIPVDPILIAMGAGRPKKALRFALGTTLASVTGACIGYYLGATVWDATSDFFFNHAFAPDKFELVMSKFRENALLAILLASFTPLPYKVFAVAGGVAGVSLPLFIGASLVGRGARFMTFGILLYKFGPTIREKIDQNFERLSVALGVLLFVGYLIYKFLI